MHYRLSAPPDARVAALFAAVRSGIAEDKEMGQDRKRLVGLCCSPTIPAPLKRAPKPVSISPA